MKIVKRITLSLLGVFLLFILSGVFIAGFYGKEVTRYVLTEIGKNVRVEIKVSQVENLSLFAKFPFASMVLYDVLIKEPVPSAAERDTLLYLKKSFLQFNILDIFQGNYKIKRISVSDGFVKLKVDKNGKENYIVDTAPGESNDDFLLKLSRMNVSNLNIFYSNEFKEQEFGIQCREAILKGNFSSDVFLMNMEGDFKTYQLKTEDFEFLSDREIGIRSEIKVDKTKGIYSFEKSEITLGGPSSGIPLTAAKKIGFEISGDIVEKEIPAPGKKGKSKNKKSADKPGRSVSTDITIQGKGLDIPSLLALLPPEYSKPFSDYESQGEITFSCKVAGEISNTQTPLISATFNIDNGSMKEKNTAYLLHSIKMHGTFSTGKNRNPSSTAIEIDDCLATLSSNTGGKPDGTINAKFKIKNMNSPGIKLIARAQFDLEKLKQFFAPDTIENISGSAGLDISYEGPLKSKEEYSAIDFRNSKTSGKINFRHVDFTLRQSPFSYRNFSGNLVLHNNDILIKELKGQVSSSDFELNGLFRNALAWLFLPEEKLTIEAAIYSNNLNLNELLAENESKKDTSYILAFPDRVNFNLNAEISHLSFRKFSAEEFHGIVTIKDRSLRSDDISFKTMDGMVEGSLIIDASTPSSIMVMSKSSLTGIDINKLFSEFENFGQSVITEKHLRGITTADVVFAMEMDTAMHVNENKIYSFIDLTIDKGELIGFEPMDDISGFIKNHIFLKRMVNTAEFEKKLKHIRFSTLQNQIEIKNRTITIPAMTINSSAMTIEAEGSHTFDNAIDYRINFFLSELLTKKEDLSQEEFGEIEDDGTGKKKIFMTIGGTLENPVFAYDKKKVKKRLVEETRQEKKVVKGILNEEFGWFKNDSTAILPKKETKEDFVIEWEENKKTVADSLQPGIRQTEKKEKNITKLLEKIGVEENKKEEDFELEKGEDF